MQLELIAFQRFTGEKFLMRSKSLLAVNPSSVAPIIHSSPNRDGAGRWICGQDQKYWQRLRPCEWCKKDFAPRCVQAAKTRFCGRSCSAKWRMSRPEHLAKVHTPEVAARRGQSRSSWLNSGKPKAQAELARFSTINRMHLPETRAKLSRALKERNHKPSVRGGNGHPMTEAQAALKAVMSGNWTAEYALSLGRLKPGYPTNYKIDLANEGLKIAIEVDGHSHRSRKHLDQKKDEMLISLGWTVLRFWNWDILTWIDTGMPMENFISMTLAQHGIQVSRSVGCSSTIRRF